MRAMRLLWKQLSETWRSKLRIVGRLYFVEARE
jgi:hypothetical protein